MSRLSITNQPAPGAEGKKRSASNPWTGVCARAGSARNTPPRIQAAAVLELRVDARSQGHHRPSAVGVVGGVPDELEVAREPDRLEEVVAVEDLEHALGRPSERAVANEAVDAPERQVPGVARRDPAEAEADSGDVERPAPRDALRQSAEGQRTVRGVERGHLRLPVRVHRPREQADVLGDELLQVDADPDLDVVLANPAEIRRARVL